MQSDRLLQLLEVTGAGALCLLRCAALQPLLLRSQPAWRRFSQVAGRRRRCSPPLPLVLRGHRPLAGLAVLRWSHHWVTPHHRLLAHAPTHPTPTQPNPPSAGLFSVHWDCRPARHPAGRAIAAAAGACLLSQAAGDRQGPVLGPASGGAAPGAGQASALPRAREGRAVPLVCWSLQAVAGRKRC